MFRAFFKCWHSNSIYCSHNMSMIQNKVDTVHIHVNKATFPMLVLTRSEKLYYGLGSPL